MRTMYLTASFSHERAMGLKNREFGQVIRIFRPSTENTQAQAGHFPIDSIVSSSSFCCPAAAFLQNLHTHRGTQSATVDSYCRGAPRGPTQRRTRYRLRTRPPYSLALTPATRPAVPPICRSR
eukprot:COSAG06_NODE_27398_length_594_cov_0.800000_1_plen_122_part_10